MSVGERREMGLHLCRATAEFLKLKPPISLDPRRLERWCRLSELAELLINERAKRRNFAPETGTESGTADVRGSQG